MKGALACYVEAARALADAGLRLRGDLVIAAVVGEIEKTQWGEEFRGAEYRGYAAGSRYLPTHGGIADMCILGEPTEQRVVLGHYGAMWARISTQGPFVHTAFSSGRLGGERDRADAAGARRGARVDPGLGAPLRLRRHRRRRQRRRAERRGAVARQPHPPPGRPLPRHPRAPDDGDDRRARGVRLAGAPAARAPPRLRDRLGGLRDRAGRPDRGVPPADRGDRCRATQLVFGSPPQRDTVRWFSDASALTRYGIETVNYGTSSGLPSADGENLEIAGLRDMASVYALVAAEICGVAA